MASKHTPGPWTAEYATTTGNHLVRSAAAGRIIAWTHDGSTDEASNARLIAAAPAMLGALRDLVEDFGGLSGGSESLDVARAILAHIDGGGA